MTTALIKKAGTAPARARIALISRHAGSTLSSLLGGTGHECFECPDWTSFQVAAESSPFDLALCDAEFVASAPKGETVQLIVLGEAPQDGERIAPAMSLSALEGSLEPLLALAVSLRECTARCRELERLADGIRTGTPMVGNSPVMRRLLSAISRAADCDATVLIEGPPGSGKSLAARMIHCKSRRVSKPLTVVAGETATAESLARSLVEAQGSTIVIEGVDQLPPNAQATLVRSLKERQAASGSAPRIVSTTSAHLPELVARGAFREDLYYRLHALPIVVPALRERLDDIAQLTQSILAASNPESARVTSLTPAAQAVLEGMSWPGNVAQLESVVRRAHLAAGGGTLQPEHLMLPSAATAIPAARASSDRPDESSTGVVSEDSILPFEEEEQRMLTRALAATKGNVRRAAQLLGIGRATLYRKIQQYQLRLH